MPVDPQSSAHNLEKTKQSSDTESGCNGDKKQQVEEVKKTTKKSTSRDMLNLIKMPAFHLIWFSEVIYFWIFSILCLIVVDYGMDRGCTKEQAETLLNFQSLGEIFGRLILPPIVDLKIVGPRYTMVIVLLICSSILFLVTQVTGYLWSACMTVSIMAFCALLYIVLNTVLVEYFGERNVTLGYGMSTFIAGCLTAIRPIVVGYFRDNLGSYNPLLQCMSGACCIAALLWLIEPLIKRCLCRRDERLSN